LCQKWVANLPNAIADVSLSFRIVSPGGQSTGRIVALDYGSLKMIEFPIVNGIGELGPATIDTLLPRVVRTDGLVDYIDNTYFELSPDGSALAFVVARDHDSALNSTTFELRVLRDVAACRTGCPYNSGDLLARREQVQLNGRLAVPRWGGDGSRIYLEVHNGIALRPDIAWVPSAAPVQDADPELEVHDPMAHVVVSSGGYDVTLFGVQARGAGEALAYGEVTRLARGSSCRRLRVIDPATGVRLNQEGQYARSADLEAAPADVLSLLTIPGTPSKTGTCNYSSTIVNRLTESAGTVTNRSVASGT
jgi:hypothetical protein